MTPWRSRGSLREVAGADDEPEQTGPQHDTSPDPFFDPARDMPVRVGGRFEILGRLGGGGMGEVFKARDRELDEVVALKILSHELDGQPAQLERLRREVKLARRISSPRVCRIHDIVELPDGRRAVTMQLVHGRTLLRLLREGAGRDWTRTARWAADIAEGLGAAHALDIVHRDLKPENVMIDGDDRAVILDFGVAFQRGKDADERLTAAGIILGTLLYMAPEQLTAAPLDGRADLYALGLVIAEAITGEVPYAGGRYEEMLKNRVISPVPYRLSAEAPGVPAGLDRTVHDLLLADREQRPSSAFYVMSELRALVSGDEPSVMVPAARTSAIRSADVLATAQAAPGQVRLGPVIGAVSVLAGLLVGGAIWLGDPSPEPVRTMVAPRATPAPTASAVATTSTATPQPSAAPATLPPTPRETPTPRPTARPSALPEAESL